MTNEEQRQWKWEHLLQTYELLQTIYPQTQALDQTEHIADRCGLLEDFKLYLKEKK